MKKLLCSLLLTCIIGSYAGAAAISAVGARVVYTGANVGTVHWVPLVTATTKSVQALSVLNTGLSVMELGIASNGASADSEVRQIYVPSSATNGLNPPSTGGAALVVPISLTLGTRISIRAVGSTATQGEFQLGVFYN